MASALCKLVQPNASLATTQWPSMHHDDDECLSRQGLNFKQIWYRSTCCRTDTKYGTMHHSDSEPNVTHWLTNVNVQGWPSGEKQKLRKAAKVAERS